MMSRLPQFRGKGRLTLFLDRFVTDADEPASFEVIVDLQGAAIALDLRRFSEKFAYYYRSYESEYISMMRQLYDGGNFLDIGSNIGIYVVSMAETVRNAGGRIFSVEPLPQNRVRQESNIELNRCLDLVEYAAVALSDSEGVVRMDGDWTATSINGVVSATGSVEVPAITLDKLAAARGWSGIGLIKMDIEGYEPAALRGAGELLHRDRPILFAEFNRERMAMNGFSMDEPWNALIGLGYRAYAVQRTKLVEVTAPGALENLFFLPAERVRQLT